MRSGDEGQYSFGGSTVKPNTTYYVVIGAEGNSPQYNKAAGLPANLNGFPAITVKNNAPSQSITFANAGFVLVCLVDAGADSSVCAGTTTLQLKEAPSGQNWSAVPENPASATIDQTGKITNLPTSGIYRFVLTQAPTCSDTVLVTVKAVAKVQGVVESVTFTDFKDNNDGRIQLSGFATGDQFNLSLGTTDENFIFAQAQPIPADGAIVKDLSNPTTTSQAYVVRIYDASGCTQDMALRQMRGDCGDCSSLKTLCVLVTARIIKSK